MTHEVSCVFAFRVEPQSLYQFLSCKKSLPRVSKLKQESLNLLPFLSGQDQFQIQLAKTKQEALLYVSFLKNSDDLKLACNALEMLLGAPGEVSEMKLLKFADAAKELSNGDDKRILQMAVQYLAAGGIDDSLVAAEYDWEFLQKIRADLEKKS